jgi:hypothetical protein
MALVHLGNHVQDSQAVEQKVQKAIFTACALLLEGFGAWFVVSGIQTIISSNP